MSTNTGEHSDEARCAAQVLERERALKDIGRLAEEVGRLTLLFADAEARCAVLTQELKELRDAVAPYRHTPEDAELWTEPRAFIDRVRDLRELPETVTALTREVERLKAEYG